MLFDAFPSYFSKIFLNMKAEYAQTTIKSDLMILKLITGYFFLSFGLILKIWTIGLPTPLSKRRYIVIVPSSNPINM